MLHTLSGFSRWRALESLEFIRIHPHGKIVYDNVQIKYRKSVNKRKEEANFPTEILKLFDEPENKLIWLARLLHVIYQNLESLLEKLTLNNREL